MFSKTQPCLHRAGNLMGTGQRSEQAKWFAPHHKAVQKLTQVSQILACQPVFSIKCSTWWSWFIFHDCGYALVTKDSQKKTASSWFHGLIDRRETLLICLPFSWHEWEFWAPLGKDAESWHTRLEQLISGSWKLYWATWWQRAIIKLWQWSGKLWPTRDSGFLEV